VGRQLIPVPTSHERSLPLSPSSAGKGLRNRSESGVKLSHLGESGVRAAHTPLDIQLALYGVIRRSWFFHSGSTFWYLFDPSP
jgi:hypothetical protein